MWVSAWATAVLRTRPRPQPTASSLVVESFVGEQQNKVPMYQALMAHQGAVCPLGQHGRPAPALEDDCEAPSYMQYLHMLLRA
jgi:hypothetical protein